MVASSVPLAIAPERVQRVIDALSMIGVAEYAAALDMLPVPDNTKGAFELLEACVCVLIREVSEAQAANDRYAQALADAGRQLADKLEVIQRQTVALADLSAPLIEVWENTLVLPIIGAIDAPRALSITDALLHGVAARRARRVLLDLTGVEAVDADTFGHIAQMIRAVELLGARCTLTGLSPAVASGIIGIGLDLGGIHIRATLKDALGEVLAASRRRQP